MIQRLQTLWLMIASALAFTSLKASFFSGNKLLSNDKTGVNEKGFASLTGMSNLLIMILTVGIAILSLVLIFLYKNRALQLKLCFVALAVSVVTIVLYYLQTKNFVPNEGTLDLSALLVFFIPVFLLLAVRGIYRDEKLVKSIDRLR